MRVSPGAIVVAVAAAAVLHLAALLATGTVGLVGTGRLAEVASVSLDAPEIAGVSPREPLRVALGAAERGAGAPPGPRAVLDPSALRRRPVLGGEWPDADARLETVRSLFMPPPELASEGLEALRALPPGTGEGATPSWADREASQVAVALGVEAATRPLPARLMPPPALAAAAEASRPGPKALGRELRVPSPPALPEAPPAWPEDAREITPPEILVDVLGLKP